MKKKKNDDGFVEMLCPVCGEYLFVDDTEEEKADPDFVHYTDYCEHCGWRYDLEQTRNPDLKNGENEMSLNEYREWFKQKIKEDPEYDYFEEHIPDPVPHMCPICGKYEFEDENSYDICPYCGWEDDSIQTDDPDYAGGANDLSLNEYKKQYENLVSENPDYKWSDQIDQD